MTDSKDQNSKEEALPEQKTPVNPMTNDRILNKVRNTKYRVTGSYDGIDYKDGVYIFDRLDANGCIWWKYSPNQMIVATEDRSIEDLLRNFIRYTPPWGNMIEGSWCMGWYTCNGFPIDHPDVFKPPKSGWKFNGGMCNPTTLGDDIIIEKI